MNARNIKLRFGKIVNNLIAFKMEGGVRRKLRI